LQDFMAQNICASSNDFLENEENRILD